MIEFENLEKTYYNQKVLDNCNLKLYPGNIYVLKGKSGSGKTTLLNVLSGIDETYSGNFYIQGKELKKLKTKEKNNYKNNVGYLMQKNLYYKKLTIRQNLLLYNNDDKKIETLAKKMGINNILDKMPTNVSGGELQRASLLRLLLLDSSILILDEPTSNLDYNNSMKFAEIISTLSMENKIIIIATHKNIFDQYANQIINIEFGKVDVENDIINDKNKTNFNVINHSPKLKRNLFAFALKNIYKENVLLRLFSIFVISLSLIALSYFINYKKSYLENSIKEIPYNVVDISEDNKNKIASTYKINKEYNDYRFKDGLMSCYTLLPYEESSMKIDGMIFIGKFPENNNEVLVNAQMAKTLPSANRVNYDGVIGSKLEIDEKEYVIVGIVGEDNIDYTSIYRGDTLYSGIIGETQVNPAVFILYDEISTFGEKKEDKLIVSFDKSALLDMYNLNDFNMALFHNSKSYLSYESKITNKIAETESPTKAALIIVIIVIIVSFFFLLNELSLELYFRKKEIGFLKLLHFSPDNISVIFIFEYMISYICNIIIALLCYYLYNYYLTHKLGFSLFLDYKYIILIILGFVFYSFIIMNISIKKYLKRDTIALLKN